MSLDLRYATAVLVTFGAIVDIADGATPMPFLAGSLDNVTTGIKLEKNGGGRAARHTTIPTVYDGDGFYRVALDAVDTNAMGIGELWYSSLATEDAWLDFNVLSQSAYDNLYGPPDAAIVVVVIASLPRARRMVSLSL